MRHLHSVIAAGPALWFSAATAGTLVPIPSFPGSAATYIRAINDNNVITGYYLDFAGDLHGFVGTLDGQHTSFDASDHGTIPLGIDNAGYITGTTSPTPGCEVSGCGFVRSPDGTVKGVHKGRRALDAVVQGILDKVSFVGDYAVDSGAPNASPFFFGFYGKGSSYRAKLTLPFATNQTRPRGINTASTVVGFYSELGNGTFPGFVLKNGIATSITYPDDDAWQVYLESINDHGTAAGSWTDYALVGEQAFLYDVEKNAFSRSRCRTPPMCWPTASTTRE